MKNKKLLVSALLGVSTLAIGAVVGIASSKKSGFRAYANPVEPEWHHYSERMPGVQPGIKEYWVQCGGNYQFTEPADADIVDMNTWDTSGFAADDDRYTYQCVKKIADSAITNSVADTAPYGVGAGFTSVQGKNYTSNWYDNAANLDLTNYDYVTFGLAHTVGDYLCIFGGDGGQGDRIEDCIANNCSFTMSKDRWYYFTLERNAQGKWDAYVGIFAVAKRASASLKMADDQKNANNLNAILGLWNFTDPLPEGKLFSTEVYAGEKGRHNYVWDTSKISPVEVGTCAVCGDIAERPAAALNYASNKYGAKLLNHTASDADVGGWTSSAFSGTFLNVESSTSLSYCYYNWNTFYMYLPRIDFTKYTSVAFDLDSIVRNPGGDFGLTGAENYYKIGFAEASMQLFAGTAADCVIGGAKLAFNRFADGKVVAKISSFGLVDELAFNITNADVINGRESVILYVSCGFNTGSCAIQISNPVLNQKPDAAAVTDASIKEIYLEKQVRRVEQQDAWKSPIGSASNEVGHADYYKFDDRDAVHFSAHWVSGDPEFTYNSGWSEWRFAHVKAGLTSVTFTYLYEDSNSETSNDGTGDVHTMAQWYGATYQARKMTLVNDGQWHTITVSGAAYDTNYFVMKIFHFTGDIYISNIIYSMDYDDVEDASIKDFYTTKQVRRVDQQDVWRNGDSVNEEGHADFIKLDGHETVHLSAHYAADDDKYGYNSGWSEWRFSHMQSGLKTVTFTYLYVDSNTDTSDDGNGAVHTMAQLNGAAYAARSMSLIADGQWHTATVTGDAYDTNYFVMKIFHFTGDIYISNIMYSMNTEDVYDDSVLEVQLNKQVRRVEQQDHWKDDADYETYGNESGHAEYFSAGANYAIHFSAHYASDHTHFGYNSGWSEWRFAHAEDGVTSISFEYCYFDSNSDTSNDGNGDVHTMAQWYNGSYAARSMTLVNDGQWHTATVTGDAYNLTHFVMKIFHFTGDIYIANIHYFNS